MEESSNETKSFTGRIETTYFENQTNFYRVMRIAIEESQDWDEDDIVVTGYFPTIHYDTTYQFYGKFQKHVKYGWQFAVTHYQQTTPTSEEGLIEYLSSNRFKGIGTVLAQRIVDELGTEAIDVILEDRSVLDSVPGLTQKRAQSLYDALVEYQGSERVFIQLNEWGFSPKIAERIYRRFEGQAIEVIRNNPYALLYDIEGLRFKLIDELGEQLGFAPDAMERISASVVIALRSYLLAEGDTYVTQEVVIRQARDLLESSQSVLMADEVLYQGLLHANDNKLIVLQDQRVMLPSLYYSEIDIANRLQQLLSLDETPKYEGEQVRDVIDSLQTQFHIHYDAVQIQAIKIALQSPVSVITGGPGTGKTTLIKAIIHMHHQLNDYSLADLYHGSIDAPVRLAAPTGRAAKRMQETTGILATTIHRLIGYTGDVTAKDFIPDTIEGDLLIIDEMSMVDTWLMHWLIQAIPMGMQVIFVGDQDQLPPVGPGKVFADLIASGICPVVALNKIYRQSDDSSIIPLAHDVKNGYFSQDFMTKCHDRSFIVSGKEQIAHTILQIIAHAIKKGYDGTNMQVLAPMYRGVGGINHLNDTIQGLLNPASAKKREVEFFNQVFRVGDKVLQLVNNAEDQVYNGDIGVIDTIELSDETESKQDEVTVLFDGEKQLTYPRSDFDQLTLAYCTSIHKSQGSEYPLVIIVITQPNPKMLRKDLLYTAITRAKENLVMIGMPYLYQQAIQNLRPPRQTYLSELLQIESNISISREKEVIPSLSPNNGDSDADRYILTESMIGHIHPMIGMENISPYDFMDTFEI